MNSIKERTIPILIALIQWFITTILQVDRLFFMYDYWTKLFIETKIIYLIVLIVFWCFAFKAAEKIKTGDKDWTRGWFVFKVYLSVMMLFLLILWPGTWSWDDLATLDIISNYSSWNPWHHIITGAYMDVLLQILPFPGGIILLQNVIIALCVAFAITKLEIIFGIGMIRHKALDIAVKLLPFMLPPVLIYQFSGYRMGLYVYIELVMLVMFISAHNDEQEYGIGYLLLFCILCSVVAEWRTESLFYIPFACVMLIFVKKRVLPNKKKILSAAILITCFLVMDGSQKMALGNSNYEIISLLCPGAELVRAADYTEDAEELSHIDKVASLEIIHNNPGLNGEALYWTTNVVRDSYTKDDYHAFLEAIIKLSIKYPQVVIAERWKLFIKGSGITGNSATYVSDAAALFDVGNSNWRAEAALSKGWIAYKPVFKDIRRSFINLLWMRSSYVAALYRLVWNAIIPELLLLYAWLELLIKKKWYLLGICTAVLIRIPIVIMTQPAGWLMYVLSFYLLGYVFLTYRILLFWSDYKRRKEQGA